MQNAIQSQGVVLKVSIPGSPTQFAQVLNLTGFTYGGKAPEIDTTNLDSVASEVLPGVPKYNLAFDANLDPDALRHIEMRSALDNRTRIEFQLTLTDGTPSVCTGFGYVTDWTIRGAVNDKVALSGAIAIDGRPTWA